MSARAGLVGGDLTRLLLAELAAAEAAFLHLAPERAVHTGRVRLKRARAIARIAMPTAPWTARRINTMAADIMDALSAARDRQALADLAERFAQKAKPKSAKAFHAVAAALLNHHSIAAPDLAHAAQETRKLVAMARALPALNADDIATGLERLSRRAEKAKRTGRGSRIEALRHTWRKREKDMHYALQMVTKTRGPALAKKDARHAALGEVLGLERDAMVLRDWLEGREGRAALKPKARARAQKLLAKRIKRLANKADRLGA